MPLFRPSLPALVLALVTGPLHAQGPASVDLPRSVTDALVAQALPAESLSAWVQPVDDPLPLLAVRAEQPRPLASVMKLVTTGAALRLLSPTHTWQTDVVLGGPVDRQGVLHGPLYVRAGGDPSLDATRLGAWLQQWRSAGLHTIRGDIVVDRSTFDLPAHDAAAFDGQPLKPYNAGPDAWLLAHQSTSLVLQPDLRRPGRARVHLWPELAGVTLSDRVRLAGAASGDCGDWRSGLELQVDATAGRITVTGSYPLACGLQNWPLRWPQAREGEHSERVWTAAWKAAGGHWHGRWRAGMGPADAVAWQRWTSPPLSELVRDINKFSNNVMARHVFLALGGDPAQPLAAATVERARQRVAEHVRASTRDAASRTSPCDGDRLVLDNGSGLSRTEGASARCMGRWVQAMWQDPLMPEWLASLPIAGLDGTARRMGVAVGRAHVKTGSLDDVSAIAGIVQTPQGQRRIVVAVVHDPGAERARPVLRALLDWAGSDPP